MPHIGAREMGGINISDFPGPEDAQQSHCSTLTGGSSPRAPLLL